MQENQYHKNIFGFFQIFIYLYIGVDIYYNYFSDQYSSNMVLSRINSGFDRLTLLNNVLVSHAFVLGMTVFVSIATKSKKNLNYDWNKHFTIPLVLGLLLFATSIVVYNANPFTNTVNAIIYSISYLFGTVNIHVAVSNLSKRVTAKLKDDIWNEDEEAFPQNEELIVADELFNLPIKYFYKKKVHSGWMNIDVFRAIAVLGLPGSGKTASIIIPYIKFVLNKGYSMLLYDFKYPDLAKIAYYHYLKNNHAGGTLEKHSFNVINIDKVEYSRRCNPIAPRYIKTLAQAMETAYTIMTSIAKNDGQAVGNSKFFIDSAVLFLSSMILFLSRYEKGQYCTLPHVIALASQSYEDIFNCLMSVDELRAIVEPYKSAYENGALEQLEGQIATVRVNLAKIGTYESFWVFSGDDIDFKLSNSEKPSILVLANDPNTIETNSVFYSSIISRCRVEVNTKHNIPCAMVFDEAPTVYLYKIDQLIATARSNKVSVVLGFQELSQLYKDYGEKVAKVIQNVAGSVISGAVRSKESLDWLQPMFGKIKQVSQGISVDRDRSPVSMNERMDYVIPTNKITNQNPGEVVGVIASSKDFEYGKFRPNMFKCKVDIDFKQVKEEESHYVDTPKFYNFGSEENKKSILKKNWKKIFNEISEVVDEFRL